MNPDISGFGGTYLAHDELDAIRIGRRSWPAELRRSWGPKANPVTIEVGIAVVEKTNKKTKNPKKKTPPPPPPPTHTPRS